MNNAKQIIKLSSIYAGAILGAGFAGGRELVTFFVRFGKSGVIASIGAGLLFMFFGAYILYKSKVCQCKTYHDYLNTLFSKKTALIFGAISDIFLFSCFVIMFSGSGALFNDCFGIPNVYGSFITATITFFVLSLDLKNIGTVCSLITPFMIIGILYVDIYYLTTKTIPVYSLPTYIENNHFILSAVLYVSYNMLSCTPVLVTSSTLATDKRTSLLGGLFGGLSLLILCVTTCIVLYCSDDVILLHELPMLALSGTLNTILYYIYTAILYMAILTTSFSSGIPLVKQIERFNVTRRTSALLLCISAFSLSFFKFSTLVEYCYTFFGFMGLFLLIKIFFQKQEIK